MAQPQTKQLKRSSASLTGGAFVAVTVAVIAGLALSEIDLSSTAVEWALAVLIGLIFGGYVRLADL